VNGIDWTFANAAAGRWPRRATAVPDPRPCRLCDIDTVNTSGLCTPCELMKASVGAEQ
jgi:hypothetical protein